MPAENCTGMDNTGGRPSIDKLLAVLDRYDWMPAVVNTKQDDINFLTIFMFYD